jgi:catechol 2,3-dioxygenase-like lactoylglutathione lyase family enzyme
MVAAVTGLTVGDEPELWRELGFVVDGNMCTVGAIRVTLTGEGRGLRAWGLHDATLDGDRVDGLRTTLEPVPDPGPIHPNGITEVDHVVVWTPDHDRTLEALASCGFELRRTTGILEAYGDKVKQAFFRPPGTIIEVVGPPEPTGDPPGRAGFFGIAFTSADLEATAALLGDRLKPAKDATQPGRRIATLASSAGSTVPFAIMSPDP